MAEDKIKVDSGMVSLNDDGHIVIKDQSVIDKLLANGALQNNAVGPNNIVYIGVG